MLIFVEICEPLRSTSVDISCSYQGETVSCAKNVLPGTRAMLACKPSYTLPLTYDPVYREITCRNDGLWDNLVFRCLPGVYHLNALIYKDKMTDKLNIPCRCLEILFINN